MVAHASHEITGNRGRAREIATLELTDQIGKNRRDDAEG
jgi:hypothetical protein